MNLVMFQAAEPFSYRAGEEKRRRKEKKRRRKKEEIIHMVLDVYGVFYEPEFQEFVLIRTDDWSSFNIFIGLIHVYLCIITVTVNHLFYAIYKQCLELVRLNIFLNYRFFVVFLSL